MKKRKWIVGLIIGELMLLRSIGGLAQEECLIIEENSSILETESMYMETENICLDEDENVITYMPEESNSLSIQERFLETSVAGDLVEQDNIPENEVLFSDIDAEEDLDIVLEEVEGEVKDPRLYGTAGDMVIINQEVFPDEAFRSYVLENLDIDKSGMLDQTEIESITVLDISGQFGEDCDENGDIIWHDLSGIECFTGLTTLDCSYNYLCKLDLSKNIALKRLNCDYCYLGSLSLDKNINLEYLNCAGNELKSLDVSNCSELLSINFDDNCLATLDFSNNNKLIFETGYQMADSDHLIPKQGEQYITANLVPCEGGWRCNLEEIVGKDKLSNIYGIRNAENYENGKYQEVVYVNKYGMIVTTEKIEDYSEVDSIIYTAEYIDGYVMFKGDSAPLSFSYWYYPECLGDDGEDAYFLVNVNLNNNCNHKYEMVIEQTPTCDTPGMQYKKCTICGEKLEGSEQIIPATGKHLYVLKIDKIATCGTPGSQYEVCTACGGIKPNTTILIPATGNHTFGNWIIVKNATALNTGVKSRVCSICGYKEEVIIPKLTPSISVNATTLPLKVKQSTTKIKVSGLAEGDFVVSWKSSDTKIVKVSNTGKIMAQSKAGKATITITLASGKTANIKIIVQKTAVKTTKISGIASKITLKKGSKTTLYPVITPISSLEKITYKTSNKKVVTVSNKGVVSAKGSGNAKITVASGKKKFIVNVIVPKVTTKKINNVKSEIIIKKGKSYTLKPKLLPSNSEEKITYISSNKKVATVSSKGKIIGKQKGTATITVKSGKVKVICKVTIK